MASERVGSGTISPTTLSNIKALAKASAPGVEVASQYSWRASVICFELNGRLVATMVRPDGDRKWNTSIYATGPDQAPNVFTADHVRLRRADAVRRCCDALRKQAGL